MNKDNVLSYCITVVSPRKFRGDLKINIESNSETPFVIITLQTF